MARVRPEQLGWYLSNNLPITASYGTGSVIISGSNPLTIIGLENDAAPLNFLTYDTSTGLVSYSTSGSGGGVGFPFSGSAVITGSLTISGSDQPLFLQTLPYEASPSYVITYVPSTGEIEYSNKIGRAHV